MISASNEHLQQQLEYTRLKPDCHSWFTMQSGREDTLEKWYAKKLCFCGKSCENGERAYLLSDLVCAPFRVRLGNEEIQDGTHDFL